MNKISMRVARRSLLLVAATALTILSACGGGSDDEEKPVATWLAASDDLSQDVSYFGSPPQLGTVTNKTTRYVANISQSGTGFRVRLSNFHGSTSATFNKVRVANSTGVGTIDVTTDTGVTFDGQSAVTLAPGEERWSDRVPMPVAAQQNIAVSIFVQGATPFNTAHRYPMATNLIADGDVTSAAALPTAAANRLASTYWLRDIDVYRSTPTAVVVAFGDSLTDGTGSTSDANHRYPNYLSQRFIAAGMNISVVNGGLGGNRWLFDKFGLRGTERFKRDVLGTSGVTHAILFLGINDIRHAVLRPTENSTADQIIAAISQAIVAAKAANVKIYLATLAPIKGNNIYNATVEAKRQAINDWIRGSGVSAGASGVLEFAKAVENPADPLALLAENDSGDHIHMSDTGYRRIAESIDLSLFK